MCHVVCPVRRSNLGIGLDAIFVRLVDRIGMVFAGLNGGVFGVYQVLYSSGHKLVGIVDIESRLVGSQRRIIVFYCIGRRLGCERRRRRRFISCLLQESQNRSFESLNATNLPPSLGWAIL
jgi:hypothetical protein